MQGLERDAGRMMARLEPRHHPSGLNSRFNGGQLPFADYVALSREMIARARSSTAADGPEKIVHGNAPFELEPPPGSPGFLKMASPPRIERG